MDNSITNPELQFDVFFFPLIIFFSSVPGEQRFDSRLMTENRTSRVNTLLCSIVLRSSVYNNTAKLQICLLENANQRIEEVIDKLW